MSARAFDRIVAIAIAVVVVVVLAATASDVGFTRDEGYYFKAGELYAQWWRLLATQPLQALSATAINEHLAYNPEHPFVMKGLFALSRAIATGLGLDVDGSTAMRFPAWLVAGIGAAALYLLGRALALPRAGALFAVALLCSMPRVFWHAHLACFDIPVVVAHVVLVLAWVRFRHTPWGAVVVGVTFGLAAGVKHNVLPVPALFVAHWLFTAWTTPSLASSELPSSSSSRLRIPLVFLALAVIGPVVYVLVWPWLWPDIGARFGAYLGFHLRHEHYPILYFGELLTAPPFPWTFPLVMWGVTIPLPALVASVIGLGLGVIVTARAVVDRLRGHLVGEITMVPLGDVSTSSSASSAVLLLLNIAFPVLLIALPTSPIFGGTKHWMNALPFVCLLAAWALCEGAARLAASVRARVVVVAVVAVVAVVPAVVSTARSWPYGLSSYNALVGGTRGAANVGLQRTFWGYEVRDVLDVINVRARGRVHFGDVNADSHRRYLSDGLLRAEVGWSPTVRGASGAFVEPQGEFKQQQIDVFNEWRRDPAVVVDLDGVPLGTLTFP